MRRVNEFNFYFSLSAETNFTNADLLKSLYTSKSINFGQHNDAIRLGGARRRIAIHSAPRIFAAAHVEHSCFQQ